MKCITRMFAVQNYGVIFLETSTHHRRHPHAYIECIPLPADYYETAPQYFKESLLQSEGDWGQHRAIINTQTRGFRRSMVSNLAYFHVWFGIDGGMGHVIEGENEWKSNFGKEILGGMMDLEVGRWRKPGKVSKTREIERKREFEEQWRKFDWTKM